MTLLRTTVIGSYPFPGWLEHAAEHLDRFGPDDIAELQEDAVIAAVHDQVAAGLDAITDGEQTRLDFNLGFYGFLEGIEQGDAPRRFGPPAHDQRGKHRIVGELAAPRGLGTVEEFERLRRVAPPGPTLKVASPARTRSPAGSKATAGRRRRRCCRSCRRSSPRSRTPAAPRSQSTSRR